MNIASPLARDQIAKLIPHGLGMCMLDRVCNWTDTTVTCESFHIKQTNPLVENSRLHTILLVEYAAQAAAVHAALLNSSMGKARPAYIGAVKNIELRKEFVDSAKALIICAQCSMQSELGAIYEFQITQSDQCLINGKLILSQA